MAQQGTLLHPTRASHKRVYESGFRDVLSKINDAVQRSHDTKRKYQKVQVLCLRWTNDDMNLGQVSDDLLQMFQDIYNFPTETFLIPHARSTFAFDMMENVARVIRKIQGNGNLLIVVYEGHASSSAANLESLSIYGSKAAGAPSCSWDIVKSAIDAFTGESLVFMDCCEATTAAMRNSEHEYLFASAAESPTTDVIAYSFTQRLIDFLTANQGRELTVAQIHAKLIENAGDSNNFLDNSPVHVASQTKPSVVLKPFEKEMRELDDLKKNDSESAAKVLISVRLQGKSAIPDHAQWESWLAENIPEDVARIKIQAIFDTASTLLLFTVPVEVWDMLKDHDAYAFVDFVASDNKYQQRQSLPARHRRTATTPSAGLSGLGEAVSGNIPRPQHGDARKG